MDTPRVIITRTNNRTMSELELGDVFLRPSNQDYFLKVNSSDPKQCSYLCLRDYLVFKCAANDKTALEYVGKMDLISD